MAHPVLVVAEFDTSNGNNYSKAPFVDEKV
jgi:hypothetical protein